MAGELESQIGFHRGCSVPVTHRGFQCCPSTFPHAVHREMLVNGMMPGLVVGHWLANECNYVPHPLEEARTPWEMGYGFVFYFFSSVYFRYVSMAGAQPENYDIEEDEW